MPAMLKEDAIMLTRVAMPVMRHAMAYRTDRTVEREMMTAGCELVIQVLKKTQQEMTAKEIAESIGCSTHRVQQICSRIRKRMEIHHTPPYLSGRKAATYQYVTD